MGSLWLNAGPSTRPEPNRIGCRNGWAPAEGQSGPTVRTVPQRISHSHGHPARIIVPSFVNLNDGLPHRAQGPRQSMSDHAHDDVRTIRPTEVRARGGSPGGAFSGRQWCREWLRENNPASISKIHPHVWGRRGSLTNSIPNTRRRDPPAECQYRPAWSPDCCDSGSAG